MKKFILFLLAVVAIFSVSVFAYTVTNTNTSVSDAGPFVPMRNGNLDAGTIYLSDGVTNTLTAMRTVVGVVTPAAGIASITGLGFRSKDDYFIIITAEATTRTFNANAATVVYEGGNSCTVYTGALATPIRFQAVGRY
jgi:hypothetical protein